MKKVYLLAVLQLLLILPVLAQTFNGNTNTNWGVSTNWSTGQVPTGTGTDVRISKNVVVESNVTIGAVAVDNNTSLAVSTTQTTPSNPPAVIMSIGASGTPKNLEYTNSGKLTVGANTRLVVWGDLIVNNSLDLDLAGELIVHGSIIMKNNGTLTVKGTGSLTVNTNFTAGDNLVIENLGSMTIAGTLTAGTNARYSGGGTISIGGGCSSTTAGFCTTILPVDLLYFKASAQPQGIQLEWASTKEWNFSHYTVERSEDGKSFMPIHTEYVEGDSYTTKHYAYLDVQPNFGANYYRLKTTDVDQTVEYKGVTVAYAGTKGDLQVYPNPAKGGLVIIKNPGAIEGTWLSIQGITGQELMRIQMAEQELRLPTSALPTGLYIIKVWNLLEVKQARLVIQ